MSLVLRTLDALGVLLTIASASGARATAASRAVDIDAIVEAAKRRRQ